MVAHESGARTTIDAASAARATRANDAGASAASAVPGPLGTGPAAASSARTPTNAVARIALLITPSALAGGPQVRLAALGGVECKQVASLSSNSDVAVFVLVALYNVVD